MGETKSVAKEEEESPLVPSLPGWKEEERTVLQQLLFSFVLPLFSGEPFLLSRGVCVGQSPLDTHGDSLLEAHSRGGHGQKVQDRDNTNITTVRRAEKNQEGPFSLCKNYADGGHKEEFQQICRLSLAWMAGQ